MDISGCKIETLRAQKESKEAELRVENSKLNKLRKIQTFPIPQRLQLATKCISKLTKKVNLLLSDYYQNFGNDALSQIKKHLEDNCNNIIGAESWIEKGLQYSKDIESGSCLFCGQSLLDAKKLIGLYKIYFNKNYKQYLHNIYAESEKIETLLKTIKFDYINELSSYILTLRRANELFLDIKLKEQIEEIEIKLELLSDKQDKANKLIETHTQLILKELENKKLSPTDVISNNIAINDKSTLVEYYCLAREVAFQINKALVHADNLKKQNIDEVNIAERLAILNKDIKQINTKIARIEEDSLCQSYKQSKDSVNQYEKNIKENETKLAENQSEYLDKYFIEINKAFEILGSKNFKLERGLEKRGHKPVYYLVVKFHDERILEQNLGKVLSESDRRALALAVFMARSVLKSEEEKSNTIILFDDPSTSFDSHRLNAYINYLKENILGYFCQTIITTHYINFIKRINANLHNNTELNYLEIRQTENGSLIELMDIESFLKTDYAKGFSKIQDFIDRKRDNLDPNFIRSFVEDLYLPSFYPKYYYDGTIKQHTKISIKINTIFSDDSDMKEKLTNLIAELHPPSHRIISEEDIDDYRSTAVRLFDLLYQ